MQIFKLYKRFHADETGAVTVDFVVLGAAIAGLVIAVLASIRSGTVTLDEPATTATEAVETEQESN